MTIKRLDASVLAPPHRVLIGKDNLPHIGDDSIVLCGADFGSMKADESVTIVDCANCIAALEAQ